MQCPAGGDNVSDLVIQRRVLERGGKNLVQAAAERRTQDTSRFFQEIVIDGQDGEAFIEDQNRRGDRRHHGVKEAFVIERGEEHITSRIIVIYWDEIMVIYWGDLRSGRKLNGGQGPDNVTVTSRRAASAAISSMRVRIAATFDSGTRRA
jgi:hypothetical protein